MHDPGSSAMGSQGLCGRASQLITDPDADVPRLCIVMAYPAGANTATGVGGTVSSTGSNAFNSISDTASGEVSNTGQAEISQQGDCNRKESQQGQGGWKGRVGRNRYPMDQHGSGQEKGSSIQLQHDCNWPAGAKRTGDGTGSWQLWEFKHYTRHEPPLLRTA
jgi:hypothetical protein